MFFIEPPTTITFGNASVAGLGVAISPVVSLPIASILIIALAYFLVAFWVAIWTHSGNNPDRATKLALYDHDPAWDATDSSSRSLDKMIKDESNYIVYVWNFRTILWEIFLPSILAFASLLRFIYYMLAL